MEPFNRPFRRGDSYSTKTTPQEHAKPELESDYLLSERELEIVRLMARGLSTQEIAKELQISEHTVSTHRKMVIKKTGSRNSIDLVANCIRDGLIR